MVPSSTLIDSTPSLVHPCVSVEDLPDLLCPPIVDLFGGAKTVPWVDLELDLRLDVHDDLCREPPLTDSFSTKCWRHVLLRHGCYVVVQYGACC